MLVHIVLVHKLNVPFLSPSNIIYYGLLDEHICVSILLCQFIDVNLYVKSLYIANYNNHHIKFPSPKHLLQ
jgi:hypothetical protein